MSCEVCHEIQEERAAIHQFDGGATRKEAEELAWKERCRKHDDKNGLFQVTTSYLCAAFTLEGGAVQSCAPILRKKLTYWKTIAVKVLGDEPAETPKIYQPPHGAMGEPLTGFVLSSGRMKHGVGKIPVDGIPEKRIFAAFDSV